MKITLYIDGREVQLNEQNLILLNYQFEDFSNPTDIKNSYSQSITLDGTDENDSIFGQMFRTDRRQTAEGFNPLLRKPFVIFNEMGEKLEEGYVKLDSIEREGCHHNYKVTLYGKLGSVFYSLAYNEDGTRKTLADLDYLKGGEDELTFKINRAFINQEWQGAKFFDERILGISDVINFVPCYNGVPDKGFDANKGICKPSQLGLPSNVDGYTTKGDYTIVTLPKPVSEWQVGDLRTYQQRPAISFLAILKGIRKELEKQGIEFDYDDLKNLPKNYRRSWVTLPKMKRGEIGRGERTQIEFVQDSVSWRKDNPLSTLNPVTIIPVDAKLDGMVTFRFNARLFSNRGANLLSHDNLYRKSVTFLQGILYKGNKAIGASNIGVIGSVYGDDAEALADRLGYAPVAVGRYERFGTDNELWVNTIGNDYLFGQPVELAFSKTNDSATSMVVSVQSYLYNVDSGGGVSVIQATTLPKMFDQYGSVYDSTEMLMNGLDSDMGYFSSAVVTDARMTKRELLTTQHSPADYLISYAKTFGLELVFDKNRGRLEMMRRETFFSNAELVDLSGRVDERSIEIVPSGIDSKFYLYRNKPSGGEFEKFYHETYGQDYGIQRINTGFDFDSKENDVMGKVIFKSAVPSMEQSTDFAHYSPSAGVVYPSPIVRGGGKYTLWKNGESKEFPINIQEVKPVWWNPTYNGYDYEGAYKLQFHDRTGKPTDGSDVLCFYINSVKVEHIRLSDDLAEMATLNNQVPCWDLRATTDILELPVFSRAFEGASLDFGTPSEINAPARGYNPTTTIYQLRWKRFVEDRLNVDSKVVKVKVNFNGMKVEEQMLRRFYWFDGCVWSLNRVINHSLTTDDLTECEFVRVQNIENYKQA